MIGFLKDLTTYMADHKIVLHLLSVGRSCKIQGESRETDDFQN